MQSACRYGNQALRFVARFAHEPGFEPVGPADTERAFIFTFFLATDEVFVYEPPIRNSGVSGGKFFERQKAHKPGTRVYYGPSDFYVGARIPLVSRCVILAQASASGEHCAQSSFKTAVHHITSILLLGFQRCERVAAILSMLDSSPWLVTVHYMCRLWDLVDADTWTLQFMEKHPHMFPWAHYPAVLRRFCSTVQGSLGSSAAREMLMAADSQGSGYIPFRRFHVCPCRLHCSGGVLIAAKSLMFDSNTCGRLCVPAMSCLSAASRTLEVGHIP